MGDRERLSELGAMNRNIDDFIEQIVGVVVKAFHVCANQKHCRVSGAAQIEVRHVSAVDLAKITHCNCRAGTFSRIQDDLSSERHASCSVCGLTYSVGMGKWSG